MLYLGEGNSTARALCLALTRFPGTEVHLRTPPGYGVPVTVRDTRGREIDGACGQLAASVRR